MERDKQIQPLASVWAVPRVKPLGNVRLFKRPEYLYRRKKQGNPAAPEGDPNGEVVADKTMGKIRHDQEGIGEHIDFKI